MEWIYSEQTVLAEVPNEESGDSTPAAAEIQSNLWPCGRRRSSHSPIEAEGFAKGLLTMSPGEADLQLVWWQRWQVAV